MPQTIMSTGVNFAHTWVMRLVRVLIPGLIFLSATAFARIGETALQFIDRYGAPRDTPSSKILDKNSPILERAIHHTYEYQGWKIRAAFLQLDGTAVRMEYSKMATSPQIKDYELQAIMNANTPPGTTWKQVPYNNPDLKSEGVTKFVQSYFAGALGEKMWQRSDGVILWLRSNLIVRLELPIAREYEAKLKAEKEQKARASVPKF
jgi:hypothetical protein